MSKQTSGKLDSAESQGRRTIAEEFPAEAVPLVREGHSVASACQWLGPQSYRPMTTESRH